MRLKYESFTKPNAYCNNIASPEKSSAHVEISGLNISRRMPYVNNDSAMTHEEALRLEKTLPRTVHDCTSSAKDVRLKRRLRTYFSPSGRVTHLWCGIISSVVVYHLWVIIYRYAFSEVDWRSLWIWFPLDYLADFLFLVDMVISVRTGFLEDGVMQYDGTRIRIHYLNSTQFYIDCLCLLPLDFLYLSIGFNSMLRIFRLCKVYKFWQFLDRAERHAGYPNIMRSAKLMFYYLTILHWNACVFKIAFDFLSERTELDETGTAKPNNREYVLQPMNHSSVSTSKSLLNHSDLTYVNALYSGMVSLLSIGTQTIQNNSMAYIFQICQSIVGLLLFATILGHVSNIITHVSAGQKEFQARLDRVKHYMSLRRVPPALQARVIDWFDYLWYTNKITEEDNVLNSLPDKLKAEIAIQIHLNTLKRVEIFQNTEEGFLSELVLRLRMVMFAPGDYVCRKGEIGKQMFIVNRGTLHVLGDDNKTILATLRAGSYFGELSILNLGQYGNRRSASVRSLGYSDLFRLSKFDLWDVLKDYPGARSKLESHAYKKIDSYKMPLLGHRGKSADFESEAPDAVLNENDTNWSSSRNVAPGHTSGDGSDGYGSDPSRLSVPVCTPQQTPTPPITQCPSQQDLVAAPLRLQHLNPLRHSFTQPLGSQPESQTHLFQPLWEQSHGWDRILPRTHVDCNRNASALSWFSGITHNLDQRGYDSSKNISVPFDSTDDTVLRTLCTNHSHSKSIDCCTHANDMYFKEYLSENSLAEDSPEVKFTINDLIESSTCPDVIQANAFTAKTSMHSHEPAYTTVPTICFEKASSSSSSGSPCSSARPTTDPVSMSVAAQPLSGLHKNLEPDTFLHIPPICVNSCTSVPLNQRVVTSQQSMHLSRNHCNHHLAHSNGSAESNYRLGYKVLEKEFTRLQLRICMLEHEKAVLQKQQQCYQNPNTFNKFDHWAMGMHKCVACVNRCPAIRQPDDRLLTRVSVKRSTSLQVPAVRNTSKGHYGPLRRKQTATEVFSMTGRMPSKSRRYLDRSNSDYVHGDVSPQSF